MRKVSGIADSAPGVHERPHGDERLIESESIRRQTGCWFPSTCADTRTSMRRGVSHLSAVDAARRHPGSRPLIFVLVPTTRRMRR